MSYIKPDALKEVIEGYFNGKNFYTDAAFTNLITPESGKIYVTLDTSSAYYWSGSAYVKISSNEKLDKSTTPSSVYGTNASGNQTMIPVDEFVESTDFTNHLTNTSNPHKVTKSQVGLGNVDNTSDANKPISIATQTALKGKQNLLSSFDESIFIENNGNIEANVSLFEEYFEQQECELNFTPIQIIGVFKNGLKLLKTEYQIIIPKTISINTYNNENIEILYTHLKQ